MQLSTIWKRRGVTALFAVAAAGLFASSTTAQTYKRHALIEEGTGTWCGYCPYGAYEIDTIGAHMGDNLVAISWHGPKGYNEPLYIPAIDTIASYIQAGGYPWALFGRAAKMEGASTQWYTIAKNQASQPSPIDFRILNTVYDAGSNTVDFDIDVTPFDLSTMAKEDTSSYVLVAVVTEDNVIELQHRYASQGFDAADIEDFHHQNVVRKVAGKVLGDAFVMGTKTNVTWPVRKHYRMTLKGEWIASQLRVKAFAAMRSNRSSGYLEAGQTDYLTTFSPSPADNVWVVRPRGGDVIPSSATTIPIVWSKSGTAGATAKIEYTTDGGVKWTTISAAETSTTYNWTIPNDAYGKTVMVRVTDGANSTLLFKTGAFSIGPKVAATIAIVTPQTGDTLFIGKQTTVSWNVTGPVGENRTVSVSTDGTNFVDVAKNVTGTTYTLTVPDMPTSTGYIRVTDGAVTATNGPFTVMALGTVQSLSLLEGTTVNVGTPVTIHWDAAGYLGNKVNIDISYDNKKTWSMIVKDAPVAENGNFSWTTPYSEANGAVIRATFSTGIVAYTPPFNIVQTSSGVTGELAGKISVSPNPLSATATISLELTDNAPVSFVVFDLLGREVASLDKGVMGAGAREFTFDASQLLPGSYGYILKAGHQSMQGKLSIVR